MVGYEEDIEDNEGQNEPQDDEMENQENIGGEEDTGNAEEEQSSESGATGADEESGSTTVQEPNTRFITNILYENNGSVYGLEVLLFDIDDRRIEKILVVDETSFDSWTTFTKQLKQACVPYTVSDSELIDEIQAEREKVGQIQSDGYKYTYDDFVNYLNNLDENSRWSSLKEMGSLEKILKNQAVDVPNAIGGTTTKYPVEINATKFMDMTSDMFSKTGHEHNYADKVHATAEGVNGVGSDKVYGHVKVINNLTTDVNITGEVLSAYQGKVLKDEINRVDNKNGWSAPIKPNKYLTYKVNEDLRLCVMNYNRSDYTGLKSKTGNHELHKEYTIPKKYKPSGRALTPLYRGDVVMYVRTNGSVNVYNLTKLKKINLYCQIMWHY